MPGSAPQGPYPVYQPVYQPTHKQTIEYLRPLASDVILAIGAFVGLFLLMIGGIIMIWADTPNGWDSGLTVQVLGTFFLTAAMLVGAILRPDMEKWVRVSLVLGAVLLVLYSFVTGLTTIF